MSMFVFAYFEVVAALATAGIIALCKRFPNNMKLIGLCFIAVTITLSMIFFSMPA